MHRAAQAWFRAQEPSADAETTGALLPLVRYELLSPEFLRDVASKERLLRTEHGWNVVFDPTTFANR